MGYITQFGLVAGIFLVGNGLSEAICTPKIIEIFSANDQETIELPERFSKKLKIQDSSSDEELKKEKSSRRLTPISESKKISWQDYIKESDKEKSKSKELEKIIKEN